MSITATDDYLIWDNTESVTFRSKRSTGHSDYPISAALGRALNWKELQASNGVYTSQDRVWLLPATLVTQSGAGADDLPKMGDIILDAIHSRWTVLEVSQNVWRTTWRLVARNLTLAYALRDAITIERGTVGRDAAGSQVITWADYLEDIPARVQPVQQASADMLGVTGAVGDYLVIVDRQIELTGFERVRHGEKYYEIRSVRNPQRIDELPVLDCQKVP